MNALTQIRDDPVQVHLLEPSERSITPFTQQPADASGRVVMINGETLGAQGGSSGWLTAKTTDASLSRKHLVVVGASDSVLPTKTSIPPGPIAARVTRSPSRPVPLPVCCTPRCRPVITAQSIRMNVPVASVNSASLDRPGAPGYRANLLRVSSVLSVVVHPAHGLRVDRSVTSINSAGHTQILTPSEGVL